MIATKPTTAAAQSITIALDEHRRPVHVGVGYDVRCGRFQFPQSVVWHDHRGISVTRGDDHLMKLLQIVIDAMVAETEKHIEK